MNLLQLINTIKDISYDTPNVHTIVDSFADLNRDDLEYSAVIVQQMPHTHIKGQDGSFIKYNIYLGYADRLVEDESNELEVQSSAISYINEIISRLSIDPDVSSYDINISTYNVFTQRFNALCAGAYAKVEILVPLDEC